MSYNDLTFLVEKRTTLIFKEQTYDIHQILFLVVIQRSHIWAQEKIYFIIDEKVYESDDVPHFNYLVYNGSRNKMWDLEKGKDLELNISEHQITAFIELRKKFEKYIPSIITRWKIDYSKKYQSKRFSNEKYFKFNLDDKRFEELESCVGGISDSNKIKDYLSSGLKKSINIFDLTGDFEINPPRSFLISNNYSIIPLDSWKKMSIEDFNSSLLFYPGRWEIPPSDDITSGYLFYTWKYKNGNWIKKITFSGMKEENWLFTKWIPMETAYLSDKDAEKVRTNPGLLKTFVYLMFVISSGDNDNDLSEPSQKDTNERKYFMETMKKARDKYLAERNNNGY